MAKKGSWFYRGEEGVKEAKRADQEAKARRESMGPMRFWLKPDSSAKATFVDSPSFFMYEHQVKIGNNYHNYFTCLRGSEEACPLCEEGDLTPSYVLVGTIINHAQFEDKQGNVKTNQKQLIVLKGKAREIMIRRIESKGGDISGCVFEFARGSSQTECATGEDIQFIKELTQAQIKSLRPKEADVKTWTEPFDYEELFKPKTPKELRELIGASAPVGSAEEEDKNKDAEEDVPVDLGNEDEGKSTSAPASIDDLI